MSERLSIAGDGLSAEVALAGAELQILRDADGRDLLWNGDPAVWTGRAPILFPIVGALIDGRYTIDGQEHALAKHGFARTSRFACVAHTADVVVLRLEDSEATRAHYPFAFRLDIAFTIAGAALSIVATLSNPGAAPLPASFGFHPALRWPLPYGAARSAHRIRFAEMEPAPVRRIDPAGLLRPDRFPTPIIGDTLMLRDDLFVDDALILDAPRSRRLIYGAPGTPAIAVDFPEMPILGIWTKPGAGYICIEPWQGINDPEGFAGDFRAKPGIVEVPPSGARTFAVRLTLLPAGSGLPAES